MTRRLAAVVLVSIALARGEAVAATATVCAQLGDGLSGRRDVDTFLLRGARGEAVRLTLAAAPDAHNRGAQVHFHCGNLHERPVDSGYGPLPAVVEGTVFNRGRVILHVDTPRPARVPRGERAFSGAYCLTVESEGTAAETLTESGDVEVPWVPLAADRGSVFPPYEPVAEGDWGGLIQPTVPLVGGEIYGVIVTTRVRDHRGRPLRRDRAFADAAGLGRGRGGPVALYGDDPEADGNPYPEARLVRPDGTIHIPDRIALRGLDAAAPALAAARADLRATADTLGALRGFSTVSPVEVALSRPVDIATVTPASVLVFRRDDRRLDLDGLFDEARRHGVARRDVALAFSFPTQEIETGHHAFRAQLTSLALDEFTPILDDPDPGDDLRIGVFGPGDSTYGSFLASNPSVGKVVVGLLPSRDFRGPDGLFDPARLSGATPAPLLLLDFILALPATGTPPYPVVVFQHGFAGSNAQVLGRVAPLLAARGIATIGISAVSHGRRGNFLDLLTATGLKLRDIFRQTNADQTALVRMIEAGVDVDRDGVPDLDAERIGYLGISLGGLMGGPFVATEPRIRAAVLNVAGGRTTLNGLNVGAGPIFEGSLAGRVGLTVGTPEFAAYLDRQIILGMHGANEADSLNFARRWSLQPFPGYTPRRILLQEGVGDALVWNVLTEELARVGNLPTDVARTDPTGVSGHWIFDNPGGHGIFDARPDVRAQAATFLESDGTTLAAP